MINKLHEWCKKWRMEVNDSKTNIVHFRNKGIHCTNVCFKLGENVLNKVEKYKYLGITLNEYLEYDTTATILSEAPGRALGAVVAKRRHLSDLGFKTFEKLFCTGVVPILGYCSEMWVFKNVQSSERIQERLIRFYLGVHRLTAIPELRGGVG